MITLTSTFENGCGDRWLAFGSRAHFSLRCTDTERPIEIDIDDAVTYARLLDGIAGMTGPLDDTTPKAHGWPEVWVMRESERKWLVAVLTEACSNFA